MICVHWLLQMYLQIFCIVVMCSSRQDFEADQIFAERQVADWGVAPPLADRPLR